MQQDLEEAVLDTVFVADCEAAPRTRGAAEDECDLVTIIKDLFSTQRYKL